jgi:DNA-binding response OmpR family regulator
MAELQLTPRPAAGSILAGPASRVQQGEMPPVRILVVEDEPLIRLFVADILEDAGFKVEEAANAAEALTLLAPGSLPFDAVIIDVGLPDKRGDALAEELRGARKELPIVIASGHDKNVLAQHFATDSCVRVLGKPYYGDMLLAVLREMGVVSETT